MVESGSTPMMLHSFFKVTAPFETRDEMEYQQYTGLQDKNGKGICEGDILTSSVQPAEGEEPTTSIVRWSNTPYTAYFDFGVAPAAHLSIIIGNIYENSELLEKPRPE